MINKATLLIFLITIFAACKPSDPKGFEINGTLSGEINNALILSLFDGKKSQPLDTAIVVDGKFTFTGILQQPGLLLVQEEGKRNTLQLFGENSKITITGSIDSLQFAVVEGSLNHNTLISFKEEMKVFEIRTSKLSEIYKQVSEEGDQQKIKAVYIEYERLEAARKETTKKFISTNASSPVAPYLALSVFRTQDLPQQEEAFALLDTSLVTSPYYMALSENINLLRSLQVGKKAPDFKLTSNTGEQVALSSFQGSIVLVDFWASWCAPCRRENPNLVNEFKKFNSKGFTILSVSIDSDQDAWRKAIVEDGLTWTQLIDTAGIASSLYGVRSIPTTYLLDREGIIVGKNLKRELLAAKLQELLN